jgi:hypothetical protein
MGLILFDLYLFPTCASPPIVDVEHFIDLRRSLLPVSLSASGGGKSALPTGFRWLASDFQLEPVGKHFGHD